MAHLIFNRSTKQLNTWNFHFNHCYRLSTENNFSSQFWKWEWKKKNESIKIKQCTNDLDSLNTINTNLDLRPNNGIDRTGMDCVWSFSLYPNSNKKKKKTKKHTTNGKWRKNKESTEQKHFVQIECIPKTSSINEQEWDIKRTTKTAWNGILLF